MEYSPLKRPSPWLTLFLILDNKRFLKLIVLLSPLSFNIVVVSSITHLALKLRIPGVSMFPKLTIEKIIQFLLDTDLFSTLSVTELSEIEAIMDIQRFRAGELIFSEGDIGDAWYVMFDGCVQVSKHMPFEKDETVARLSSKACFGEMAILDSTPRSATIFALETARFSASLAASLSACWRRDVLVPTNLFGGWPFAWHKDSVC